MTPGARGLALRASTLSRPAEESGSRATHHQSKTRPRLLWCASTSVEATIGRSLYSIYQDESKGANTSPTNSYSVKDRTAVGSSYRRPEGDSSGSIPEVTVGLPVYNGEQYLPDALQSICGQSFADFELIISDNASTDRTAQICTEMASRDA